MRHFKKFCAATLAVGLMLPQIFAGSGYQAEAAGGKWKHNSRGWWYSYSKGSYAKSEWVKDGGKWYYFDAEGYMVTGWKKLNNKWYYFTPGGAMATGWKNINGKWYHFSGGGVMQTGWKKLKGKWYFFTGGGDMLTGWYFGQDAAYYLGEDGAMVTGNVIIDGEEYIFDDNGILIAAANDNPDGAWEYFASEVTDEQKDIFTRAMEGLTGVGYEPVQLVGRQVVSGTNYLFLCHATVIYPEAKPYYALVTIYEDLEGNVKLSAIDDSTVEVPTVQLAGGYNENEDMTVTEEVREAFDGAIEGFTGSVFTPFAYVGSQVVSGLKYRVLCQACSTEPGSIPYFSMLEIYDRADGIRLISNIINFGDEAIEED